MISKLSLRSLFWVLLVALSTTLIASVYFINSFFYIIFLVVIYSVVLFLTLKAFNIVTHTNKCLFELANDSFGSTEKKEISTKENFSFSSTNSALMLVKNCFKVKDHELLSLSNKLSEIDDELTATKEQVVTIEKRLSTISNNIPVFVLIVDKLEFIQYCNSSFERWYGLKSSDVIGFGLSTIMKDSYSSFTKQIKNVMEGNNSSIELSVFKNSVAHFISFTFTPFIEDGKVTGFYIFGNDITESRNLTNSLTFQATHDALTELPNRRSCMSFIENSMARSRRSKSTMGVFFIDINNFKDINDTYGHATGDAVLVAFSKRLRASVRETDSVCRVSGDDFVIVAEGLHEGVEAVGVVTSNILKEMTKSLNIGTFQKAIEPSIGVALYVDGKNTAAQLLTRADMAMHEAKKREPHIVILEQN